MNDLIVNKYNDPVRMAWTAAADALADMVLKILVNRTDVWGGYSYSNYRDAGNKSFTAPAKADRGKRFLDQDTLQAHYAASDVGDVIGLHAIGSDNRSRWAAADIDCHGSVGDPKLNETAAIALYKRLQTLGIRALLTDSNGEGGYHLLVAFEQPVPSETAFSFGLWMKQQLADLGLPGVETFPKQPKLRLASGDPLDSAPEYGNWLRLPGHHHTKEHYSRVYDGEQWLVGEPAVQYILKLPLCPTNLIPASHMVTEVPSSTAGGAWNPGATLDSYRTPLDDARDIEMARECLEHIPNDDLHYDDWFKVGAAAKNAGCELSDFVAFSQKSGKHKAGACERAWQSLRRTQGNVATLGTLVYLARQNDFDPYAESTVGTWDSLPVVNVSDNPVQSPLPLFGLSNGATHSPAPNGVRRSPRLEIQSRCLADVKEMPIEWTWKDWIPNRAISLIAGRGGVGKSYLTSFFAARVSTDGLMPDGAKSLTGDVLLASGEDAIECIIMPRLRVHGADCNRIHTIEGIKDRDPNGNEFLGGFTLEHIGELKSLVDKHPQTKLLIIDPIGSFIGSRIDTNLDNKVRSVLQPLSMLASERGFAVIIVAHHRKSTGSCADDLILGSRGFTALARSVFHVFDQDGRKLFLRGKGNISPHRHGMAFGIENVGDTVGKIKWEDQPLDIDADAYLEEQSRPGPSAELQAQAEKWLADQLQQGRLTKSELAHRLGTSKAPFSMRTVERAMKTINLACHRCPQDNKFYYSTIQPPAPSFAPSPPAYQPPQQLVTPIGVVVP